MKKLFIVLAVASLGFVACNNEAENKEDAKDSTENKMEPAPTTPAGDSTTMGDSTHMGDSAH